MVVMSDELLAKLIEINAVDRSIQTAEDEFVKDEMLYDAEELMEALRKKYF